uniref:AtC3H23-like CCCH zinc finger domain-containing protein n=1 Tax=Ananas comosus var. bracteatus TaxID=296719 RepID=A0A6V7NWZ2_ANACO|nr:unnamed protein product [Ananas comosus var. bracteatus]
MYSFKVRPCSRAYLRDWTECPFVHPGENARGGTRASTTTAACRARTSARAPAGAATCAKLLRVPFLSLHLTEHHPSSPADGSKKLVGLRNGSPSHHLRPKLVGFPDACCEIALWILNSGGFPPALCAVVHPLEVDRPVSSPISFSPALGSSPSTSPSTTLHLRPTNPRSLWVCETALPPSSLAEACGFAKRWLRDRFADLELRWVSPGVVCSRAPTRGGSTRFLSDLFLPCIGFLSLHLTEHHSPADRSKKLVVHPLDVDLAYCDSAFVPVVQISVLTSRHSIQSAILGSSSSENPAFCY